MFELIKTDKNSKARAGLLRTDHGVIETPIFMPVGTQGTVKAIDQRALNEIGAQIILGNTYHLYLRPGTEVLNEFAGLHNFMNWDKPILTDSGGYQVFSLQDLRKIKEDGIEFKSHIDGSLHWFSPEKVVEIQQIIGSDIMMQLDECIHYPAPFSDAKKAVERSARWAKASLDYFKENQDKQPKKQHLFAIGQGSEYKELRKISLEANCALDFNGFAIGGLSVGEPTEIMYDIVDFSTDIIPQNKPRYLMGVGTPENILEAIERGVDMFDCVLPTRNARNGQLFTSYGKINIKNFKYKFEKKPIDESICSWASNNFSLSYLRHLLISKEILGLQLSTYHNLAFYLWLTKTAREKILKGEFLAWKKEFLEKYSSKD